jgi:hypothetical protein
MVNGLTRANAGNWQGAGPYADIASDSASKFIPQIWSGKLVEKFYAATVFGAIANTDYEGEISDKGDQVIIRTTPTMTIQDYEVGLGLTYETPISANTTLDINNGKYFAFAIDDVDSFQSDIDLMDDWSEDASEQMKIAVDSQVLANLYAGINASNKGIAAGVISSGVNLGTTGTNGDAAVLIDKTNILDFIVDMGLVLDEQNVPETGRWLVMPAWMVSTIKKSDLKDASLAGDSTSIMRNGLVGMVDRFYIYLSNNIAGITEGTATLYQPICGHPAGLTFAAQMTKMENLPNPDTFGQLIRGLNVYGYKVIEGKYLAGAYVKRV